MPDKLMIPLTLFILLMLVIRLISDEEADPTLRDKHQPVTYQSICFTTDSSAINLNNNKMLSNADLRTSLK